MPSEAKPAKTGFGALKACNRIVHLASCLYLGEWALYGAFRCPFVVPFVSCQNCPVLTCPGRIAHFFWGFWAFWIALGLFFGRAFCGWFCPGGFVNRVFALNPLQTSLHRDGERQLNWVKYFLFFCALWVYFLMDQPRVNVPIRFGEFIPSVFLTFEHAFPLWLARAALVLGAFALALVVSAAWCRFACPAGALLDIVRRFAPFKMRKTDECSGCGKCQRQCYMRTRPDEENCTSCGDCLHVCPQGCIHFGLKKRQS